MQHAGGDAVLWIDNEAVKAGFEADRGMEGWLGSVVKHGGVEMSGMCWFFYQFARGDIDSGDSI